MPCSLQISYTFLIPNSQVQIQHVLGDNVDQLIKPAISRILRSCNRCFRKSEHLFEKNHPLPRVPQRVAIELEIRYPERGGDASMAASTDATGVIPRRTHERR